MAVNEWVIASIALLLTLVPCLVSVVRGSPIARLVAFEMAGVIDTLVLLALAQAFHRDIFFDLAFALALLSLASGFVFARFLERWV